MQLRIFCPIFPPEFLFWEIVRIYFFLVEIYNKEYNKNE